MENYIENIETGGLHYHLLEQSTNPQSMSTEDYGLPTYEEVLSVFKEIFSLVGMSDIIKR